MKITLTAIKWLFIVWGSISLLGVIIFGGYFVCALVFCSCENVNKTSPQDVRFVLNWCGLGDERIEKVIHSYESARSFTGDHIDVYAIKISDVKISELTSDANYPSKAWYRGDQLPKVLDDAVAFVESWKSDKYDWFPKSSEIRSGDIYIYPWSIYYHGINPTAAEIIFVRPRDKMVYFFSGKT